MISTAETFAYIKSELGTYFTTEAHPNIYLYINSAINYIYNYRDWQFLRKTYVFEYVTPGSEVTIPFNMKTHFVNDEETDILNEEDWFRGYEGVCISGDKFKARVAGTYTILYTPGFTKVTADSVYIDLPDNFEDAVKNVAVHFGFKKIRDYDTANQVLAFAKSLLDPITERSTNTRPRKKTRTGSRHNIF